MAVDSIQGILYAYEFRCQLGTGKKLDDQRLWVIGHPLKVEFEATVAKWF